MSLLAFFTAVLFVPGAVNPATAPRWALLALTMPFFWYFRKGHATVGHLLGACFLAWALLSLTWTFNLYDGVRAALLFGLLGLIFCSAPLSLRQVYGAMAVGLFINSAIGIAQVQGWDTLSQAYPPGGLFFNKNFGAELSAMVLAGVVVSAEWRKDERLWWAVPGLLPTLVLSHCRGAWLALGVAGIILIYQYNRAVCLITGAVLGAAGLYYGRLWDGGSGGSSVEQRIQVWQDTWDGMTFWGRGLGSFYTTFPEHSTRLDPLVFRPSTAHTDLLNLTYELGPGVLLLLGLLIYALRTRPLRAEHYVLVVFLVEGLVGFPLYLPATAFLAALVLGSLCRDRPELRVALACSRARVLLGTALRHCRANAVSPAAGRDPVAI